jgi:hypothetical protein
VVTLDPQLFSIDHLGDHFFHFWGKWLLVHILMYRCLPWQHAVPTR